MAKKVDPLKAKEAKQKKIAIGGAVLLVLVLAVQGPKTLKMLKGPTPPPPAEASGPGGPAVPETGGPAVPPTGGAAAGGVPATTTAAPAAELASVPDSDPAPEAEDGQLVSLARFSSKDPFAQQAQAPPSGATAPPPDAAAEPQKPATDPAGAEKPATPSPDGFTTGGTPTAPTPSLPAAPALAAATSIAVNGVAEDLVVDDQFPKAEPTFVLVSVAADLKSVEIGIAGGSYASGGETLKLVLGKKLTLQNTADGSRYELELRSIAGAPLPKSK
jgi:hypothetical protein